ncbi:MAG: S9 family peptidase [Actinobacteria bacterium]|nr:MAG: S9 family peptidase [Actinomycetota bacterium]
MGAVAGVVDLRALLELRTAVPADSSDDTLLVRCDLPGTMQLYTVPLAGGELVQITDAPDPVDGQLIDGAHLILLERDHEGNEHTQLWLVAEAEEQPLVVEPEFVHRDACLSRDRALLAYTTNRENGVDWAVVVRTLRGDDERELFAPGGWNTPVGFSPDGSKLVVQHDSARAGDNDLYLVDVATGDAEHVTPHDDDAWFDEPVWLVNGSGFYAATNEGRDTKAIKRYHFESRRWSVAVESDWDLECHGDDAGRWLLVHANEDGYSRLELRDTRTLDIVEDVPLPGRGVVEEPVFAPNGSALAFKFSSPVDPGDVWTYDVDERELRRATELPRAVDLGVLREPELHRFESFDGESIPVFLWEPEGDGPFPVVVTVHGGPESQYRPAFLPSFTPLTQHLVSRGYAVAAPNVRGSTGYGKRYEHLDDVRLRLDSVRDLSSLHDWLGTRPRIDAARAVLYGRSYGGYMVLAGLAFQPERWAAGIECVGISNFVTFLENTAPWRRAVREPEYGTLERDREFLIEASPITHVDRIRAPLFIQHGANDPRVPLEETEQIHRVLTEKGIRCELLVHQDEGHAIGKLENRVETFERAVAFLEEVLR